MNTKNFLVGGIVGGVVFFLLGYLFYGVLLVNFFHDHPGTATNVDRAMADFEWWALILGNLFSGFFLAYVFTKSGVATAASGLVTGAILGFLVCTSFDLTMYGTTNIASKQMMAADIAASTVMSAITGAIVAVVIGMLNRSGTATNRTV